MPNFITCLNLFSGCIGIIAVAENNLILGSAMIFVGAIFDFFDGFVARLLKVHSELGKQLDSMADMVTFGVLPGFIMAQLIRSTLADPSDFITASLLAAPGFLITVFSGIRLAKFNIDTRQTSSFIGLPTPANSLFIGSLPLIISYDASIHDLLMSRWILYFITITMSLLLIAEIPLFSLKFKSFTWNENKTRFSFLIFSLVLLIIFHFTALPLIVLLYIILSVIQNLSQKSKVNPHEV